MIIKWTSNAASKLQDYLGLGSPVWNWSVKPGTLTQTISSAGGIASAFAAGSPTVNLSAVYDQLSFRFREDDGSLTAPL